MPAALDAYIREAMRDEGLVGIARVVLYRRERLMMPFRKLGIGAGDN